MQTIQFVWLQVVHVMHHLSLIQPLEVFGTADIVTHGSIIYQCH